MPQPKRVNGRTIGIVGNWTRRSRRFPRLTIPILGMPRRDGRPKVPSTVERQARRHLAKGTRILRVAKTLRLGTGTVQRSSEQWSRTLYLRSTILMLDPTLAYELWKGSYG
jgi:hypothetical protein